MKAEKLAGPYQVDSKRIGDFCWDSQHAWSFRPQVYLGAVAKAKPAAAAAARLGLALLALNSELKVAGVVLLGLMERPEHQGTAHKMTLQIALKYLTEVHHGEILPCARLFASRSGARPQDWDAALRHAETPTLRLHDLADEISSAWKGFDSANLIDAMARRPATECPGHDRQSPMAAAADDRQVDRLPSSSQRALIRSLEEAAKLGVPEVCELAEHLVSCFLNCDKLRQRAGQAQHGRPCKGRSNSCIPKGLAWEHQVVRRRADARSPVEEIENSRVDFARTGPEIYAHRAEIAALAPQGDPPPGQPAPSWFRAAPCGVRAGERARPQTARCLPSTALLQHRHADRIGGGHNPSSPLGPRPQSSGKRRPRSAPFYPLRPARS